MHLQPQQPLVCDSFKNFEILSSVALIGDNCVVRLGKLSSCEQKAEAAAAAVANLSSIASKYTNNDATGESLPRVWFCFLI